MEISFANQQLQDTCNSDKAMARAYGPNQARKLRRRLDDLTAAACLADVRHIPGRCHELRGSRSGQLAMSLEEPDRLVFEPLHDPVPRNESGNLDWSAVTAIRILEVVDYHD